MNDVLREYGVVIGVLVLAFQAYCIWEGWRFRRRALRVPAELVKSIRYSKHISYYLSYRHMETTKVAEYCGPGLLTEFKPGDKLEILIDPDEPPDVQIPEGTHIRFSRSGNCIPADESLVSLGTWAFAAFAVFLILYGLGVIPPILVSRRRF